MKKPLLILSVVLCTAGNAFAHAFEPLVLSVAETGSHVYSVLWKIPTQTPSAASLEFPNDCRLQAQTATDLLTARLTLSQLTCAEALAGRAIRVTGLDRATGEVVVRYEDAHGAATGLLNGAGDTFEVPANAGEFTGGVFTRYLALGVEHILTGFDHLLFLLVLLLWIGSLRGVFATVTAFTVAHSLTLGAAVLGWVHVPQVLVEALIALSIAVLAAEVAQGHTATVRRAWPAAFGFGLLHGFGFAGALSSLGVPAHAVPTALFAFNLGVEAGQLVFVSALLGAFALLQTARISIRARGRTLAYGVGVGAAVLTLQRMSAFWF